MEKPSWRVTLFTQLCLCLALFLAFHVALHQKKFLLHNGAGSRPLDLYFISVRGGFRSFEQQTHLLKQMEIVAKTYGARFIVNTSEVGEDDPLMHNGTHHFPSIKVPWYTTPTSKVQKKGYFIKHIQMPNENSLDFIVLNTGLLQDPSSGMGNDQLLWLTRTLEASSSNWCIVVGFHSLAVCNGSMEHLETKHNYEPLHCTLLKFGVNVYLSGQECTSHALEGSGAYIRNLSLLDKQDSLTSVNGQWTFNNEMFNGFLLHRVSSLEITTYFVTSTGEVMHRMVLQQRGRGAM